MFNLTWNSGYEIAAFVTYMSGALMLLTVALRGTFCCPRKLSQTVWGVLCEMAANGANSGFMVHVMYTFIVGGIAYVMHWHIFALLIAVCSVLSFAQGKIFEFRRRRFKIAERVRKEQSHREELE